jgi:hypothetical protein
MEIVQKTSNSEIFSSIFEEFSASAFMKKEDYLEKETLTTCVRNRVWEGADKSLALQRQEATGLKKYISSTYSPLSSTHLWLRCSNFFNPSEKNYFGCAANRKTYLQGLGGGIRVTQRRHMIISIVILTLCTLILPHDFLLRAVCRAVCAFIFRCNKPAGAAGHCG